MSVTVSPLQVGPLVVTPLRVSLVSPPGSHGALTGLEADDHPQYFDQSRGDIRYALTAHQHVLTDLQPLTPEAPYAFDVTLIDAAAAGADQPPLNIATSGAVHEDGPAETTSYYNHVLSAGWNVKAPASQATEDVPGFCTTIESRRYGTRGVGEPAFQSEWQLRGIRPDGTQFRPLAIAATHDGTSVGIAMRTGILRVGAETTGESLDSDIAFSVRPAATRGTHNGVLTLSVGSDMVHGARALDIQFAAGTDKTQVGLQITGSSNWGTVAQINNNGSGETKLDLGVAGAAPAYFHFFRAGGQEWAVGKNSSDDFEIAASSVPGSFTAIRVDKTTRQTEFRAPPRLPSYTVPTLPSASAVGAGALAYVTDASGGPTLACSDGTSWREVAVLGSEIS